jgi:hypothetical protein
MIKKRMKSKLVSKSYKRFCEYIDAKEMQKAARVAVYLAIATNGAEGLFHELKYANFIFKLRTRNV